jgi:hypothetical protein
LGVADPWVFLMISKRVTSPDALPTFSSAGNPAAPLCDYPGDGGDPRPRRR